MRRYIPPGEYHCPVCGEHMEALDKLYEHDGQWRCERCIREVIGLLPESNGAEFELDDICFHLGIRSRTVAGWHEEEAHRFRGDGELD